MNSEQFIKSVENGEYPINKELLDNLYLEQEDLLKKMAKYRDKGDVGTYKNLVRSLADVTALIDNMWKNTPIKPIEKWQEKFSHYHADGKELISTWEQKGEDIRNKKIYEVKEKVKEQPKEKLCFDFELSEKARNYVAVNIFFNGELHRIKGTVQDICRYIVNLIGKKSVCVHGDFHGVGIAICDELRANGIEICDTKCTTFDAITGNIRTMKMKH